MKHLLLSVVSFFHHPQHVAKPALNTLLLDRTISQLAIADQSKLICVYPFNQGK